MCSLVGVGLVAVLDELEDEATIAQVHGLEPLLLTNLHAQIRLASEGRYVGGREEKETGREHGGNREAWYKVMRGSELRES